VFSVAQFACAERSEHLGWVNGVVCHGFVSPFGELLLALPKSNQKASPEPRLFPAVLATGGTRTNRPMARYRARWAHGAGLRPPVAPLLGAG
jgi:hypothetical protein